MKIYILSTIVFFSFLISGCGSAMSGLASSIQHTDTVIEGSKAAVDLTKENAPKEDYIIGLKISGAVIDGEMYSPDSKRVIYLNSILQTLKRHSTKPYIFNDYKIILVKNSSFNAFALPGGIIVIHDGVFKKVYNEDQLAAIIAHEIGHIEAEHFIQDDEIGNYHKVAKLGLNQTLKDKGMSNNSGAGYYLNGLLNKISNNIIEGYSVEQEAEADAIALKLLKESGYESKALTEVLNTLKKTSHSYGGGNYPKNRIDLIEENEYYITAYESKQNVKKREKRFDIHKYERY